MGIKLSLLFILAGACSYLHAQETTSIPSKQKIALGARNTWHHFQGPVQIDSALQLPNRPIADTANSEKNKKLKHAGVLFYGTKENDNRLYYYDGNRFVTLATGGNKDSSIYATNGTINEDRTAAIKKDKKLYFKTGRIQIDSLTMSAKGKLLLPVYEDTAGSANIKNKGAIAYFKKNPTNNTEITDSAHLFFSDGEKWVRVPVTIPEGAGNIYSKNDSIKSNRIATIKKEVKLHFKDGKVEIDSLFAMNRFNLPKKALSTPSSNDGALFYSASPPRNLNRGQITQKLYYSNGTNFIQILSGRDSSIYSANGTINENRTVTLNRMNHLSFMNNDRNVLMLKQQNVGIGTNNPLKNLHLKGSIRIEGEASGGASDLQGRILSAINNQGDAQWRWPANIYTTDGTIKMAGGGTRVTVPDNTILRFAGGRTAISQIRTVYRPKGRSRLPKSYSTRDINYLISFGDVTRVAQETSTLSSNEPWNSTYINAYGNLVISSRDNKEDEKSALSLIPFVIDYEAKRPTLTIYNEGDWMQYVDNLGFHAFRRKSNWWRDPRRWKNMKALICGDLVIEGGALVVSSDKRIKNIKGKASVSESVQKLKNLDVYHYQFKDTLTKGSQIITGVIAQEVQKVIPEAILTTPEAIIPDIYKHADSIRNVGNNTRLYLPMPLNLDSLKVGTKLKFYLKKDKAEHRKILSVTKNYIEVPYLCEENERVFVYGSFINDLLNVDYNQIFMENVNATKHLLQQQESLEQKLKTQQKQINTLKEQLKEQANSSQTQQKELKELKILLQKLIKKN